MSESDLWWAFSSLHFILLTPQYSSGMHLADSNSPIKNQAGGFLSGVPRNSFSSTNVM